MNLSKRTCLLSFLALMVAGYFSISYSRALAQTSQPDSDTVNALFSEAKTEAHQLESDADHMKSYLRSNLTFESHAMKINMIREHVNNTGKLLSQLEDARESASPWQQKAIDEIRPLLQEIADNTTLAIEHVNANQDRVRLKVSPYDTYLSENYELAKELAALITDYVDYGQHKAKLGSLEAQLGVPSR